MGMAPDDLPEGAALTSRAAGFREGPHDHYDRRREADPFHEDTTYACRRLTRFADVRAVLRHKRLSVDARRSEPDSYMRRVAGTGVNEASGDAAYEPPLARLEAQIAFRRLLERVPHMQLDPEHPARRRALPFFRGFTTLPLQLA